MNGRILGQQPQLGVVFVLPEGQITVDFVVDTGYEGALTLPVLVIAAMNLPFHQRISANLADDSRRSVDVHRATILWHDQMLNVAVLAMGQRPLLGTSLLVGSDLSVYFEDGGLLALVPF